MTADSTDWTRTYWLPGPGTASLLFYVFGTFRNTDNLVLPDGFELSVHAHEAFTAWDGYPLGGSLGELFAEEAPQTLATARQAPEVLRIAGDTDNPPTLNYLRSILETISGLLVEGGVAVVDPMLSTLFDADAWQRRFHDPVAAPLRQHVLVLCDEDPYTPGRHWAHTRGMIKFGRPDLSLVGIPPDAVNPAGVLCERLLKLLAMGGQFADGQALEVQGLGTLVARLGGNRNDPRFHNQHVELVWPDPPA